MRAEASRLRFKKKRLRADRRVQVRIRSSSLARLHSARPFALPAAIVVSKLEPEHQLIAARLWIRSARLHLDTCTSLRSPAAIVASLSLNTGLMMALLLMFCRRRLSLRGCWRRSVPTPRWERPAHSSPPRRTSTKAAVRRKPKLSFVFPFVDKPVSSMRVVLRREAGGGLSLQAADAAARGAEDDCVGGGFLLALSLRHAGDWPGGDGQSAGHAAAVLHCRRDVRMQTLPRCQAAGACAFEAHVWLGRSQW